MNIHFTYKISKTPDLEKAINTQVAKLERRLQLFRPELVSLYGAVDENSKTGTVVSLNLRLPSGQLASRESADRPQGAIKGAFEDLIEQLTKHKDHLRATQKWPRVRRVGRTRPVPQVPFEETLAAAKPEKVSGQDISAYINLNLPRFERFVERELRYRENRGTLQPDQISVDEVIGEAISRALDDREERPEKVSLEPWLYRLSLRAIDRLMNQSKHLQTDVSLESQVRAGITVNGTGSDEPMMQFHQPDESLTNENLIPDLRTATPEDVAATDEIVAMVEMALRDIKREDREAFILFTMEGFTTQEIASISERPVEDVRASIANARQHLNKNFPVQSKLKDRLVEQSRSA